MARKRKESLEGQIHVGLAQEELLQLKNICTIRMESNLEGFCRKLILEGLKREATDILSSVALSSLERPRDACGPVCDLSSVESRIRGSNMHTAHLDGLSGSSTGRLSSCQGNIVELDPPWLASDPRELNNKGLRGGEADEESLQKPQGTERANMQSALQGLIAAVPDQPQTNPTSVRPQGSKNTIA